jgi:predicted glutamine amidotransferase
MCRWIAYRGETTAFEHYVTEPEHSLVTQSLRALEATTGTNGDGFGLGWYGDHPEPGLYRETRPAWSDENLRYLCRHLHSHLFFAHYNANTLYFREDGERLIVVSEPFDKEPDWTEVPPNHVLVALASRPAEIVPFLESSSPERKQERPRLQRVVTRV